MHPLSARGAEPPTKCSKRGGFTGPQIWEAVAGKEGLTFFRGGTRGGGVQFYEKNKLKPEIFNDKKFINKNNWYKGGYGLKRRAWKVCRFKEEHGKKEEDCFRGEWHLEAYNVIC